MGRHADAVAEGLVIALSAVRLSVKNNIVMGTIALGEPYERARYVLVAREALLALALESEAAARLADRQRKAAWGRFSPSDGTHDYRDRDVGNLRRRRRHYRGVAKRLRRMAGDPDALADVVERAREAAWSDVESNLARTLAVEGKRPDADPDYARMREARMQALRLVDLQRLAAQHRRRDGGGGRPVAGDTAQSS